MKWLEAEQWLQKELSGVYNDGESSGIASMVMEKITGSSRSDRSMRKDNKLDVHQLHQLTEINQRLQRHEPVQYILGESWFGGMKFFVDQNVLIPRPETEELVEWIISDVKAANKDVFDKRPFDADETTSLKILDAGTGSGCIALTLKKRMPKAEVWGCDISEAALNVARRNGSELDIRVDFQGMDFLDRSQQKQLPSVDILVSNPPYVPDKDKATMQTNVVSFEPHTALFVPDNDPLIFYKAIADYGKHRLHPNGTIYCEIHESLGYSVVELFRNEGYTQAEIRKDMQGKERMVKVGGI